MLAKQTTFVLEQPRGSLLFRHNRWEWLVNRVAVAAGSHYLNTGLGMLLGFGAQLSVRTS